MAIGGILRALLLKNWLLWRRELKGSLCELLFPVLLCALLLLLKLSLPPEHKHKKSYINDNAEIIMPYNLSLANENQTHNPSYISTPVHTLFENPNVSNYISRPFHWCEKTQKYKWRWSIVTKNCTFDLQNNTNIDSYLINNIGYFLNSTEVFYGNTNYTNDNSGNYRQPKCYTDEDDLDDHITSSSYDDHEDEKFCFAVVINENYYDETTSTHKFKYHIRYNFSDTNPDDESTFGSQYKIFETSFYEGTSELQRKVEVGYQRDFVESGFLHIENIIHNYFLNLPFFENETDSEIPLEKPFINAAITPMYQLKYLQDTFSQSFAGTLGFLLFLVSMMPIAKLISRITQEKESKVREAMKMMGLTDTPYWLSWMIMYGIIYTFAAVGCTLVTIPIFEHQNKFVVFLVFFLYGLACMTYSMLIGAIFSKAKTAILVGLLVFFVSYFPLFSFNENTTEGTKTGISFFCSAAMAQGFTLLLTYEGSQIEIGLSNLDKEYQNFSMQICVVMLIVDIFIYLILALYLDKVIPGEYGVNLPWYFPFTKSFWLGHQESESMNEEDRSILLQEERARKEQLMEARKIEEIDPALARQIENGQAMIVKGLRKHFGSKEAVGGLDLEMFEGEIFALLGHNGAGKTTTISMLTGMLKPSAGEMTVNNLNFKSDMAEIRKKLGVCPQHDILFKKLTVEEHLYIFSRFKGMSNTAEIQAAIDEQIQSIDLTEKRRVLAMNLSGGQKRKLSLAIALIGGSKIVMLDEPTSGMDLTARRKMWDMLRNDKRGRIIILTTHYMEEADILADRIAIMSEGRLNCLGSPLFLKNRFGVGYNLTIVKKIGVNSPEHSRKIKNIVDSHIENNRLLSDASAEISFRIPMTESPKFRDLFREIDGRLDELELETYGISVTTLEEVFLRVARGDDDEEGRKSLSLASFEEDKKEETTPYEMETLTLEDSKLKNFNVAEDRKTGCFYIFFTHFWALLEKRAIYSMRDYKGLFLEIFLPLFIVVFGLVFITQLVQINNMKSVKETVSQFHTPQDLQYNSNATTDEIMWYVRENFPDIDLKKNSSHLNVTQFDTSLWYYADKHNSKRMGAIYFEKINTTAHQYSIVVFQNSTGYQSPPVYMNIAGTALVNYAWNKSDTKYKNRTLDITVYNHPLPITERQRSVFKNANTITATMIFAIGMAFIPTGLITFIVKERENNVKHQHLVSGVSIPAYWISAYFWDLLKYQIPGILSPLFILAFDLKSLIDTSDLYEATWMLFILFGLAIPLSTYCHSFLFKNYSTGQFAVFMFNLIAGAILPLVTWILRLINEGTRDTADILQYFFRAGSPLFCFAFGLMNVSNRDTYQITYGESHKRGPFDWDIAGADMFFLFLHAILSFIGLYLIEYLSTVQWIQNALAARDPGPNEYEPDDDVENIKTEVKQTSPKDVAVKCDSLRQVYGSRGGDVKVAIEEVSFLVPFSQCFALLGVNGAGKTSTFRILTGEYAPTSGDAFINGYSVVTQIQRARFNIGYCPQYDALSELLTPREHLKLYARIKGIPNQMIDYFVEKQMNDMGIKKYEKTKAGALSGGNKRKLSVAIACIGNPPVVFLDEPSAGMDPEARKNMWKVINGIKRQKCSIILTTHSMDEAEALCNSIAIMVAGRFKCYGSTTHIKNKFSKGYEFLLKVQFPSHEEIFEQFNRISRLAVEGFISQENLVEALNDLGGAELIDDIAPRSSGQHIFDEMEDCKEIEAKTLIEWVIVELAGKQIFNWLYGEFGWTNLIEHYGAYYKFKLEKSEKHTLSEIFGKIEEVKENLRIGEYSLSETTLEQIFNMFATEQDQRISRRYTQNIPNRESEGV